MLTTYMSTTLLLCWHTKTRCSNHQPAMILQMWFSYVIMGYMFLPAVHTIYSPMYEIEILCSILIVCDGSCILVHPTIWYRHQRMKNSSDTKKIKCSLSAHFFADCMMPYNSLLQLYSWTRICQQPNFNYMITPLRQWKHCPFLM